LNIVDPQIRMTGLKRTPVRRAVPQAIAGAPGRLPHLWSPPAVGPSGLKKPKVVVLSEVGAADRCFPCWLKIFAAFL
jgi:hypothetical protein